MPEIELLTAAGERRRLPVSGGRLIIGRGSDSDVFLPDHLLSRRHAEIEPRGGAFYIIDLGSTNGTFLNGERVEGEIALESGDRITIGGVEIRYCCVDAGTAVSQLDETRTVVSYWPSAGAPASETLRGDLAKVPLFAVLQMLEMGSQSGCLAVETPDGEGFMWLERGRLVHAECGKGDGFEAALDLAQASAGRFDFAPGSPAPERSFSASVTEVILEATRLLDEASGLT